MWELGLRQLVTAELEWTGAPATEDQLCGCSRAGGCVAAALLRDVVERCCSAVRTTQTWQPGCVLGGALGSTVSLATVTAAALKGLMVVFVIQDSNSARRPASCAGCQRCSGSGPALRRKPWARGASDTACAASACQREAPGLSYTGYDGAQA